jgi:hypothetical protein
MNYDPKQLLQMSQIQMDDLFKNSPVGTIPEGRVKGTFIAAPDLG